MIYLSRDYSFTKQLDHRFTQYRCPACFSYHVAVKSVVDWPDASANIALGEGEMECQSCKIIDKGNNFQALTQSNASSETLKEAMREVARRTGDEWINLTL